MTAPAQAEPAAKPESRTPWGNPTASSFRKHYIRLVQVGGAEAAVHKEIADIVAELFRMAEEQGALPAGEVAAYDKNRAGEPHPAAYGVRVELPGVEGAAAWGFEDDGEAIIFRGDIEAAREWTQTAQELHATRQAPAPATGFEGWLHEFPGRRDLTEGDGGDDVQFLQAVLGCPEQDGRYHTSTAQQVAMMQRKFGLPETGEVDRKTWAIMFPKFSRFSVGRGEAGFSVRVIQAALWAYGHEPDQPVTGRYGKETDKAVRRLQEDHGLRVTGHVRGPEWVALLGARADWPQLGA